MIIFFGKRNRPKQGADRAECTEAIVCDYATVETLVAIYNDLGFKLITYTYDAWGNFTRANIAANASSLKDTFTYRGYYYDSDLGLYYLNSRYYDPITCRFISADTSAVITVTPTALTDKNLYAYCNNNPVTYADHSGEFPLHILIGAAVGFIGGVIDQAIDGDLKSLDAWVQIGISTIEGAATAAVGPAAGALISGITGGVSSALAGNDTDKIMTDILVSAGISLIGSCTQLAVGRIFAGEFVEKASKTQLKYMANSMGYVGRNFKTSSSWTGKIMFDASKKFMDKTVAIVSEKTVSFIGARVWNAY